MCLKEGEELIEDQIASKIAEFFVDDAFLKEGSFSAMIKDPDIKKAADELLFGLIRQELTDLPCSIKEPVERMADLIRNYLYSTAASLI